MNVLIESTELQESLEAMDVVIGATTVDPQRPEQAAATLEKIQPITRSNRKAAKQHKYSESLKPTLQLNRLMRMPIGCKQCNSKDQRNFTAELAIHFPGLDGLHKPIVWVYPKLLVCRHCGFTEFEVPQRELSVLRQGKVVEGAVALGQAA